MKSRSFLALSRVLPKFFQAMDSDPRISTSHMAVYFAMLRIWADTGFSGAVEIFASDGAKVAKLSKSTYFTCLRDLHDFGYLVYVSSFKNDVPSKVYLRKIPISEPSRVIY